MALVLQIGACLLKGVRIGSISTKALAAAIVGLTVAGCTSSNSQEHGPGMMSGGSPYHYSKLTCTAPGDLPGRRVNVMLADMGMTQMMGGVAPLAAHMRLRAVPATVAAGTVTLVAMNMGWRTHELVVVPLAVGAAAGQRIPGPDGKVDETGSLGEASTSCGAGAGDGIRAGSVGWTTLTLAPGRYELLCNLRNHYADGMYQELVVTGS
jgi:uncharacterized cupredoxin-like copper-binding protein